MSALSDKYPFHGMRGYCDIKVENVKTGIVTDMGRHNVICDNFRTIMRNLVFGKFAQVQGDQTILKDAPTLEFLVLGDANKTLATVDTMQEATSADSKLVNPTVWVPLKATAQYPDNSSEMLEWNGSPSIRYSVVLPPDQANPASGFFCELGLAIPPQDHPENYLVTRIARTKAIPKSESERLYLTYYLGF